MITEDEEALRSTLNGLLPGEGYVVDTANNGKEGSEKAMSLTFDLIGVGLRDRRNDANRRYAHLQIARSIGSQSKYPELILTVVKVGCQFAGSKNA